jgi:hypothetical protein
MLSSLFRRSETFRLQASLFKNRFSKGQDTCLQFSVANKGRNIKVLNENLYDMQVLIMDRNYRYKLLTLFVLDIYGSVHQDTIYENDQQDATV